MKTKKRILSLILASAVTLTAAGGISAPTISLEASAANNTQSNVVEYLDRGICAVNTGAGMLVNWRFLASDPDDAVYRLYRGSDLIYTSTDKDNSYSKGATCFLDKGGNSGSSYRVECLSGSKVISNDSCSIISNNAYFDIKLDRPGSQYTPNDMSVGDVDGDGVYELFLKWDPSNSKDNSQKGKTDNVYIDCYTLSGKKLWRIDLGVNIRAGAHYTQFFVADFDLDGKAEMCCKTADGTKDGTGKVIGDGSKDYRNSSGFIITGAEYYTLFDGATGAALDTVNYEPDRGNTKAWGKSTDATNRVDRFWGMTAYLDGVHPCVVTGRGYYGRMTATAYAVENKKLKKLWMFDTGTSSSTPGYGDGNHNSMPADVDGDGKQEIITGSTCIDDNGKLLWNLNKGHGDAMHVGDLDPTNPGLEAWICHEDKPYGVSLVDCDTGKILFHNDGSGDTGRCCGDNVWAGNPGAELWGNREADNSTPVKNVKGETLSCRRPAINFLSYWDGDLEREILDGYTDSPATISKINEKGTIDTLLTTDGYYTCNTTKGTPCLSADIFGDWREELIVRAASGDAIRIYATTYDTDYRVQCLMHDPHYRAQVSAQNTAYNQPPHTSFFLGTGYDIPERPKCTVNGSTVTYISAFETIEAESYSDQSGVKTEDCSEGGQNVGYIENGDYIMFKNVDFEDGAKSITVRAAGNGANIEIYLDSLNDSPAATLKYLGSGNWQNWEDASFNIAAISGKHDLYLKFTGGEGFLLNINNFVFSKNAIVIPKNGNLIKNLIVKDEEHSEDWNIFSTGGKDLPIFGDRDFTFTEFPENLSVVEAVRTACDSKYYVNDLAEFTAAEDFTLYIAVDSRVEIIPEWLSSYEKTEMICKSSNDVTFTIYKKDVLKDEIVTLGTNGQSAYCVNYSVFIAKENAPAKVIGDVNADGVFSMLDIAMMQKYIVSAGSLTDPLAGDVCEDGNLNVFDLVVMKEMIK